MKPKFKIGDFVKSTAFYQAMMVITIIENDDYLKNTPPQQLSFNVKYKCAWIKGEEVFSDYFTEADLVYHR